MELDDVEDLVSEARFLGPRGSGEAFFLCVNGHSRINDFALKVFALSDTLVD